MTDEKRPTWAEQVDSVMNRLKRRQAEKSSEQARWKQRIEQQQQGDGPKGD